MDMEYFLLCWCQIVLVFSCWWWNTSICEKFYTLLVPVDLTCHSWIPWRLLMFWWSDFFGILCVFWLTLYEKSKCQSPYHIFMAILASKVISAVDKWVNRMTSTCVCYHRIVNDDREVWYYHCCFTNIGWFVISLSSSLLFLSYPSNLPKPKIFVFIKDPFRITF